MSAHDDIESTVKAALTDALMGVWHKDTDPAMIERLAGDIAEQKILATAAKAIGDVEGQQRHQQNLRHLLATVESIATSRYVKAYQQGILAFSGALRAVIGIIIHAALT